jgi:hypothetical protein
MRGSRYVGDPGQAIVHERRDYTGDGPAFTCDRCGARVSERMRRHAPGGGRAKPWSACGSELDVAEGRFALPYLTSAEATQRQLVSKRQIARRWFVSEGQLRTASLPDPVAVLTDNGPGSGAFLYDARTVDQMIRTRRPYWALQVLLAERRAS